MFEEALQIAEKRRKAKGKGEKERYTHLNAEFQRQIRKSFKVINENKEENKRIRLEISSRKLDTKGTFDAKKGTIKDINGMDLTESEDIKKR